MSFYKQHYRFRRAWQDTQNRKYSVAEVLQDIKFRKPLSLNILFFTVLSSLHSHYVLSVFVLFLFFLCFRTISQRALCQFRCKCISLLFKSAAWRVSGMLQNLRTWNLSGPRTAKFEVVKSRTHQKGRKCAPWFSFCSSLSWGWPLLFQLE